MRKKFSLGLLSLAGGLLALFLLPASFSEAIRGQFVSLFLPLSEKLNWENKGKLAQLEEEVKKLQLENSRLREDRYQTISSKDIVKARIIFRSHAAWQSFAWIDLGQKRAPFPLKNAPVMAGEALVGIVEEVGPERSRIRLITDPHLIPSVRASRKGVLLAKGELRGAREPSFRRPGPLLSGTGFNYDFPDREGDSKALNSEIIKQDDLLVTTGLDGAFPKGLKVAKVTKVIPLKEGDFYYDIEAESLAGNLNGLDVVYLLPPL